MSVAARRPGQGRDLLEVRGKLTVLHTELEAGIGFLPRGVRDSILRVMLHSGVYAVTGMRYANAAGAVFVISALVLGALTGVWLGGRPKRKLEARGPGVANFAAEHGLQYLKLGSLRIPSFGPSGQLRVGQMENQLSGRWRGLPVTEADHAISSDTRMPHHAHAGAAGGAVYMGHQIKTQYLSFLQADLTAALPGLMIRSEVQTARPSGDPGLSHRIDFGSTEFSRAFEVTAADAAFATGLIDAAMIEWLLSAGPGFTFRIQGQKLLVWCRLLPVPDLAKVFDAAKGFTDRIPHQIWVGYGAR